VCGRFLWASSGEAIADFLQVPALKTLRPRFNVAPTQPVPSVAVDKAGVRQLGMLRWGLVPRWSTDPKKAPTNARAETAAERPFFADSLRLRRCLIPADGFYEWQQLPGRRKRPFALRLWDDKPFAFAGLWDVWKDPAGRPLPTFCILTTTANELVKPVHGRMPVIVPERHLDLWLARDVQEPRTWPPFCAPTPRTRCGPSRSGRRSTTRRMTGRSAWKRREGTGGPPPESVVPPVSVPPASVRTGPAPGAPGGRGRDTRRAASARSRPG
jgi:putative SOS response-associated peptidase YedK